MCCCLCRLLVLRFVLLPLTSYEATTVIATIHHFHWHTNSEGGEMQCLLEALQTRMTLANISSDSCKSCDDAWRPGKLLIIMPCISSLPCVCPLLGRKIAALYGTVGARSIALILLLVPYTLHCEMPISSATKLSSHGSVYAKKRQPGVRFVPTTFPELHIFWPVPSLTPSKT